jgi:UDP-2-acetamido-3-amino-2,3-dideoxy-glucuronate N-acetyltransferase
MPIAASVTLGSGVVIHQPELVNLYGCTVGTDTKIGAFVEIQKNAVIGSRCKISSHTLIERMAGPHPAVPASAR